MKNSDWAPLSESWRGQIQTAVQTASGVAQDVYECLQIVVMNGDLVTCMTRPPGQRQWDDFLVKRLRRTGSLTSAVHTRIDDRLASWTSLDWE